MEAPRPVQLLRTILRSLPIWFFCGVASGAPTTSTDASARWSHGPPTDPNFFPIAVWLQNPSRAELYRKAGINTYVGLYSGPTEEQLSALRKAGMKVICHQNAVALEHRDDPTIIGWMHGDEPDNAQSLGKGKGYGPPILPEKIVRDYERIRAADPSRPVLLNLGQGVAWDNYIGRGTRRNHPEDYLEYIRGCDIASFDIYPVVHDNKEISGKLNFVAQGVERLSNWSKGEKMIWNCLECTHISNPDKKASPHQVRAEAWMSIIHGSRGLIYFVHQFKPTFREPALLDDPEMLQAVTVLNAQITSLAAVLNSPSIQDRATVQSIKVEVPVHFLLKEQKRALYLFAVGMREDATTAHFKIEGLSGASKVAVLGENRELPCSAGAFSDSFAAWDAHVYKIEKP